MGMCVVFVCLSELAGVFFFFLGFVTLLYLTVCLSPVPLDIRAEEDCGVHMPHSLLRQYCSSAVG